MRINSQSFFSVPADKLAVNLLGKVLVRQINGIETRYLIAETECYMGIEDTACHASRGKTKRTGVLWERGGTLYVHMIYGLYFMLNIVAGEVGDPMGVLIRGVKDIKGPGLLTKHLQITKEFNREDLLTSKRIWLEDINLFPQYNATKRIGINYAAKQDIEKLWRYTAYEHL